MNLKTRGIIDDMSERMNFKQSFFLIVVFLLILVSTVALIAMFLFLAFLAVIDTTHTDDIFGPAAYMIGAILIAGYLIPYFVSLTVLWHSGYNALKSTSFAKAKCLHYISSGINLVTILMYVLAFAGIISRSIPEEIYLSLDFSGTIFKIGCLTSFIGIVLDIIGTILYKRDKKRQLKSADSQKTA